MFYFITHDVCIFTTIVWKKLLLRTTMLTNRHGTKHKEISKHQNKKNIKTLYFYWLENRKHFLCLSFPIYSLLFHSFKYKLRTICHKSFDKTKQKLSRNFINHSCLVRRWMWKIFAFNWLPNGWLLFFYFYYVVCPQIHIKNANRIRRLKNQYKLDFIEKNCVWINMTNLILIFYFCFLTFLRFRLLYFVLYDCIEFIQTKFHIEIINF